MNFGFKPVLLLVCFSLCCGCQENSLSKQSSDEKNGPGGSDVSFGPVEQRSEEVVDKSSQRKGGKRKGPRRFVRQHDRQISQSAVFDDGHQSSLPTLDWLQFRGPQGHASSSLYRIPRRWSDEFGVFWRLELIGRGASSPIVANERIFLTAASGYGESAEVPGDVKQLRQHLICLNREDGAPIWKRDIQGSPLTQRLNSEVLRHGFASSTPVADDARVYVLFGATGVFAFDYDGNLKWQADVGFLYNYFGSSASLVLHEDLLIVNASIENETVYALDKRTGRGVWKIDGVKRSFSMPVIGETAEGKQELVLMEEGLVRGFEPSSGEELWRCQGIHNYVVATPFVKDGVCYCNGGIEKQMMAIKLGGSGDVTETHKLWEVAAGANVPSPIIVDGQLYLLSDNGIMQCFDARNGKLISRKRLPSKGRTYSSPFFSNDVLYIPLEDNSVFVCQATSEFEELSHNVFESDQNSMKTSLVPTGRGMLMRNDQYLYMIGRTDESSVKRTLADRDLSSELIVPRERYDFSAEINWRRPYNFYLERHRPSVDLAILGPYESLLSEDQKEESRQIITSEFKKFVQLRLQQQEAYWTFLKSGSEDSEEFLGELKRIEKATEDHANQIRLTIKRGVMTAKQLEQHIREVAERQKPKE